jgi:hypothetical protein
VLVVASTSLVAAMSPRVSPGAAAQQPRSPAEREASDAQRDFEVFRRFRLPRTASHGERCDIAIGRVCYWHDNADAPLPAEQVSVTIARERLRARLDSLRALDATSDYVIGQSVRYALDARDARAAATLLRDCGATSWWCLALRGLAWHRASEESLATAAFDSALAAMPDSIRCEWLDVSKWLPPDVHLPDDTAGGCAERDRFARRVVWLAAPLLTWRPAAARNEFLARRAFLRTVRGTATPHSVGWGSDIDELALRFGWPDSWAREDEAVHSIATPQIRVVGHEPTPSFDFVPDRHAFEAPLDASPDDWRHTGRRKPRMRYAPVWLSTIDTLPVQIARFQRAGGDSMLVVAAFDVRVVLGDSAIDPHAAGVLTASPESTLVAATSDSGAAIVLVAARRPVLAAVEVVDPARTYAARWRGSVQPLDSAALVSDILVGRAAGGSPPPVFLESAASRAIAPLVVSAGDTLALYWETYARATREHPARVRLRLVPLSSSFFGRLARTLRLKHRGPPVSLAWDDPGEPDARPGRALRVAIPDVPEGSYRIELTIQADGRRESAARTIVVR